MTITGQLARWARLRNASGEVATVTRVTRADATTAYIVETPSAQFHACDTWRDALDCAARALA